MVWPAAQVLFLLFSVESLTLMVPFSRDAVNKDVCLISAHVSTVHLTCPTQGHISRMSALGWVNPGMSFQSSYQISCWLLAGRRHHRQEDVKGRLSAPSEPWEMWLYPVHLQTFGGDPAKTDTHNLLFAFLVEQKHWEGQPTWLLKTQKNCGWRWWSICKNKGLAVWHFKGDSTIKTDWDNAIPKVLWLLAIKIGWSCCPRSTKLKSCCIHWRHVGAIHLFGTRSSISDW